MTHLRKIEIKVVIETNKSDHEFAFRSFPAMERAIEAWNKEESLEDAICAVSDVEAQG